MSLVKRCFGVLLLTLCLSVAAQSVSAAAATRSDVSGISAALAITHNHVNAIGLHANRTNQTCLSKAAHFLAFEPRDLLGENKSPRAEATPAAYAGNTLAVVPADQAYLAKIILLLIIAVLGVTTFRKFRANKADADE